MPKFNETTLWNCEDYAVAHVEVPLWIDQNIRVQDIAAIQQGGCASGAYMPACYYSQANDTMHTYGDDVLEYIDDIFGSVPAPAEDKSWREQASFYLSLAVETWALGAYSELVED